MVDISFDPTALVAHGRDLANDAASHPPSCTGCQPAAPDEVSTAVAASFTAWATALELLVGQSVAHRVAGGLAVSATGVGLDQGDTEAAAVISSYGQAPQSSPAPVLPTAGTQAPPLPVAPAVPAVPAPMPAETWSSFIHGGPGSEPLRTLAAQFRTAASELEKQAGETERAARGVDANWNNGDQPAGRNLATHASWLTGAASYAKTLATSADSAANTVDNARTATPTPETFRTLRREYQTALQKFNASGGAVSEPLVIAKTNMSAAQAEALAAQTSYATAANVDTGTVPAPPPAPPPIVGEAPGGENPEQPKESTDKADDRQQDDDPEQIEKIKEGPAANKAGTDGDSTMNAETDSFAPSPGEVAALDGEAPSDPAAASRAMAPASDATAGTAGAVLGSILGTVGQAAGSTSGMMPGGGGGSPLSALSGLSSIPGMGGFPGTGGTDMGTPEDLGFDDLSPDEWGTTPASSGGGGGSGGLPAGGPSSSVSAAAPGAGVPAPTAPSPPPSAAAAPTGRVGGPMGGMIPPMMGGMGANNSGERDTDLHPDKRVVHREHVNTEPVFGELEQLRKRPGRRKSTKTQEETDGDTD